MQRNTTLIFAITFTLGFGAASSVADARERSGFVRENRFREALRAEEWREALTYFASMKETERTGRLTYLAAQAHVRIKELSEAATLLEGLLETRSDNLEALYLLARVRAREGKMELAKGLLLEAAQAGQLVTRDIAYGEGKELFGALQRDPHFVLQLMRRSQEVRVEHKLARDPFRPPPRDWKRPEKTKFRGGTPAETAKRLEREIGDLLEAIARHAEDQAVEPMLAKLSELRGLIVEYEGLGIEAAKAQLRVFKQKHRRLDDLSASIQLHLNVVEGNLHLKVMAKHYAAAEFAKAIETFETLELLCERMKKHPREVFANNASALWERGRRMRDAAQVRLEIAQLELKLTGIVVPAPEAAGKAIVNDRVHAEGDSVYDPKTLEDHTDLVVVRVAPGRVTFRYRGVTFVRALERGEKPRVN